MYLLHDPNLSFKDVLKNFPNAKTIQIGSMLSTPVGCSSPLNIYHTDDSMVLKDESIRKLKEELPISADELNIKEEMQQPKQVVDISVTDKEEKTLSEKSNITSCENEDKTSQDVMEVDSNIKTETKDAIQDELKPEEKSDTPQDVSKEELACLAQVKEESETMEVCEENVTENTTEAANATENTLVTETDDGDKDATAITAELMDVDNVADSSGELKIDEDAKAEDEETDIETDLRKEEDDAKDVVNEKHDEPSTACKLGKSLQVSPTTVDDVEKDDQKYDCDTDTESKCNFEPVQTVENDESPLVKMEKAIKSEKCDSEVSEKMLPKVKQEELMFDDGLRDKYNIRKMFPKDELHSHVDDSQMIAFLQGCMSQNDDVLSQASFNLESEMGEPTVAQLLAFTNGNAVRWPKDKVLQIRLEHIVHAVEKNEWPIIRHTFLPTFPPVPPSSSTPIPHPPVIASPVSHRASPVPSVSSQGHSGEVTPQATPEHTPQRETILPEIPTPTPPEFSVLRKSPLQHIPQPPVTDSSKHRRRRRRRRFEIEAERAKLRQLLSHNMQQQQHHHQQQLQHVQQFLASSSLRNKIWDEHVEDKVQHPNVPSPAPPIPTASPTIPPPAHQNSSPRMATNLGSLDLRVKSTITPPTPFTPDGCG